jgi:broad specificity phosphatase PhoE
MYFLRHGLTDYNVSNKWMGLVDIPLNKAGKQQIYSLVPSLKALKISVIYTSPLARAKRTSEIIAQNLGGLPLYILPDLKERNVGDFEGLIKSSENRKLLEKSSSVESTGEVALRVKKAFEIITNDPTALVVSHSAVYRCIVNELKYSSSLSHQSIPNSEIVEIYRKPAFST